MQLTYCAAPVDMEGDRSQEPEVGMAAAYAFRMQLTYCAAPILKSRSGGGGSGEGRPVGQATNNDDLSHKAEERLGL